MAEGFQRNYEVDDDPGWPERGEEAITFRAGVNQGGWKSDEFDGVRFYPQSTPAWFGNFERGWRGQRKVAIHPMPEPNTVLVVAGCQGYIVNVEQRTAILVPAFPIKQVVAAVSSNLLLAVDFTAISAIGQNEVLWKSERLVCDDLEILAVNGDQVTLQGFDGGEISRFLFDMVSRRATGRAS